MSQRGAPWREGFLLLLSGLVCLAVVDRLLCLVYPAFAINGSALTDDDELGWKLRPNHVIAGKGQTINSAGFRGEDFTGDGDPSLVAFIGDSVTFGATTDEGTIPRLFQELSGRTSYNFGTPG